MHKHKGYTRNIGDDNATELPVAGAGAGATNGTTSNSSRHMLKSICTR